MKPRILVIGLPKSGTSTLHDAFNKSGIPSAHWMHNGRIIGKDIYDGWYDHGDPFHHFTDVEAITQLDYCYYPDEKPLPFTRRKIRGRLLSLWPNLDIPLLLSIRRMYPDCKFILNFRPIEKTVDSFSRWGDLQTRVTLADCPGLPSGRGTAAELERWIASHVAAIREIFGQDKNFLDLNITSDTARDELAAFLGCEIAWWGVSNKNTFK